MRLKAVSEHKDTATTPDFGIMSIAGLAAAGNVPFVSRAVWSKKEQLCGFCCSSLWLIWEEDACWQLKEAAWQGG